MVEITEISAMLQKGKAKIVKEMVQQALDEGQDPKVILNDGLLSGMMIIGTKFKNNEVFVPEVLVAARAMNAGLGILEPKLVEVGNEPVGRAVIGTVKGDLHDIGKNLVAMMLKGAGFDGSMWVLTWMRIPLSARRKRFRRMLYVCRPF